MDRRTSETDDHIEEDIEPSTSGQVYFQPDSQTSDIESDADDSESDDPKDDFERTYEFGNSDGAINRVTALKSKSDAFCDCYKRGKEKECRCGEEDSYFDWVWDEESKSSACFIKEDLREVMFHIDYSCGTAAVRGTSQMKNDQYYWEIKMTTPVYGTDMMVGVGTSHVDLNQYRHMFCSMIGLDSESWGLSYTGTVQNKRIKQPYSDKYGQGSIIGVHLDMWHGTLSFYKNRRPLGIAYRGLHGKVLYPMVSSTAARSGMKVIRSCSFPTSLQFLCCQTLRKVIPLHLDVLKVVNLPPGLNDFLENNIRWLLQPCPPQIPVSDKSRKRTRRDFDSQDEEHKLVKKVCG
ncbi:hypothetical protein KUTeg_003043 [Tegillarca granosa]|uniref:SPRY domain-containing SOCS box protein 3 n=1 Tax=Tegillarca granosa TaxID=220873 RepID=A0ABQ9FPT7_TEGGR|nr:hypothetical protein KUTeg_003043 [Tegillarca granosa]